jgi:glycosyltransferase involved in cell wall biosynthesis
LLGEEEVLSLWYVYPRWHKVSFTLIAEKHVEYLRKLGARVQEVDELAFPSLYPVTSPTTITHPHLYIMLRVLQVHSHKLPPKAGQLDVESLNYWRSKYDQLVAVDVCDSDRMSAAAVELLNMADKVVVPSSFCKQVYETSGVKKPVYVVPHGVDPEWYETGNVWDTRPAKSLHPMLVELLLYKLKKNKRLLLFWLWHSPERKGWMEVYQFYRMLRNQRDDVVLVLKTAAPRSSEFMQVADQGAIEVYGWLTEYDKMALYDLVDVTLNFSRGGGFELNCLESLARGTPCVASNWGSWLDYLPGFLQVRRGLEVEVLPGNIFHVGRGYTVDVEDAVTKVADILDNYEEYRAKTMEWREKVLKPEFRWDVVAQHLLEVVSNAR